MTDNKPKDAATVRVCDMENLTHVGKSQKDIDRILGQGLFAPAYKYTKAETGKVSKR